MKELMNDFQIRGERWTAKTLTSHRVNSPETRFGADFIGVVNMDLPTTKSPKAFWCRRSGLSHARTSLRASGTGW